MSSSAPTIQVRQSRRQGTEKTTASPRITLDLFLTVLSRTLFQPFIACLLPFCLRALATPYTSTSFLVTSAYAAAICTYHLLALANQRLAYGRPRQVNWKDEVVVITGGCRGLGACTAEIYGLRGVSVAVLDISVPEAENGQEKEGVYYFHCDVAIEGEVRGALGQVREKLGEPTILINNAGMAHNWTVESLNQAEDLKKASRVVDVNLLSNFYTTSFFLQHSKGARQQGTIVTVCSVLGYLGAANLSAYSASKAATIAWHRSLSAELAITKPSIRTILVATGQLDTEMFAHAKVQGRIQGFFAPVLGAGEVAMRIVGMIDSGRGGEVRMPFYAEWIALLAILPASVQKGLRWWSGIDVALNSAEDLCEKPTGARGVKSDSKDVEREHLDTSSESLSDSDDSNL